MEVISRFIQQFTIVRKYSQFKVSYRFATDQTFASDEATEFRARYRMTLEIPLNGTSADKKEFYLKTNLENLNSWQGSTYDLEARLVPLLGYKFTDNNKTEIGLDYRINSFIRNGSNSSFWVSINWFIVL